MNDNAVYKLAEDVVVLVRVNEIAKDLTIAETAAALGVAVAILSAKQATGQLRRRARAQEDDIEEDETPDWEDEQRNLDLYDKAFVLARLRTRYPASVIKLINSGELPIPKWLWSEMKERR